MKKTPKNRKNRISKSVGLLTQILNFLKNASFGPHDFKIAMLFRDTLLINGMIYNVEVLYNLAEAGDNEFENIDKLLFGKLPDVPKTTPTDAFYLEFGPLPINLIIKSRRITYLHDLLTGKSKGWHLVTILPPKSGWPDKTICMVG